MLCFKDTKRLFLIPGASLGFLTGGMLITVGENEVRLTCCPPYCEALRDEKLTNQKKPRAKVNGMATLSA